MAFPTNYRRYQPIVIPDTSIDADLTNYTVMILRAMLNDEIVDPSGGNKSLATGADIRFSSDTAGATQLAADIILWEHDSTTGADDANILAAVKVPSVTNAGGATIYIWYSSTQSESMPADNSTYGADNAYDSNWKGFWPLVADANDRTSNATTLTAIGSPTLGGIAGPNNLLATSFDGSTKGLYGTSIITVDPLTIVGWAKPTSSTQGTSQYMACINDTAADNDYTLVGVRATTGLARAVWRGTATFSIEDHDGHGNVGNGWTQLCGGSASDGKAIIKPNDTTKETQAATCILAGLDTVSIGYKKTNADSNWFTGSICMVSIHNVERGEAWAAAMFDNINVPATFGAPGTPVNGPGFTAIPVFARHYSRQMQGA